MHSVIVTFHPEGTKIEARAGERILDVLSYARLDINNQCGGEGVCGKCRVKIMRGRVNFSSKHLGFLTKKELEAGLVPAAMKVLLENLDVSFNELDTLYVAGGFGAHLDIDKAIFIGLLPDIPRERIRFIGNSSLAGARITLLSTDGFRKAENIANQMTYFELSVHPEFMTEFVASLFLPHTQMELFPSVQEGLYRSRKHV